MTPNDATQRLHDAAARLGYEVTWSRLRKYYRGVEKRVSFREMEEVRAEARCACDDVPAKESREIYSAAYDAGTTAAVADLGRAEN